MMGLVYEMIVQGKVNILLTLDDFIYVEQNNSA